MIAGVVLAAGRGARFGGVKPLAPFAGRPMIHRPISALAGAGIDDVIVVVGANAEAIERELAGVAGCRTVRCERWEEGQSRSLQTGLRSAELLDAEAVVVLLADQPLIEAGAVKRVVANREPAFAATRASYEGVPGHPVVLEKALWPVLHTLTGDQGARAVLNETDVRDVPCDGLGSAADVDSIEDLDRIQSES